jgi:argininosuccinate lyase
MRSVLLASDLLTAVTKVINGLRFRPDRMKSACTPELFATHRALKQVKDGVPFRAAYRAAAEVDDTALTPENVLSTYHTDGSPGQGRPDVVRGLIEQHAEWLNG